MSKLQRLFILLTLPVLVFTGVMLSPPEPAEAASVRCSGPDIMFGRQRWCGYFKNIGFDNGQDVRLGGIPSSVNRAQEFINMVIGDLSSSNAQRRTGAQFLILTMLGRGPGMPKSVSPSQRADWIERVRSYANISENGTTSYGENGRIDWKVWQHMACGTTNTYYQVGQDDVAPFRDSAGNSDCETSDTDQFLLFRNRSGSVIYRIRRECMNPMGTLRALEEPQPDNYNLIPAVSATVDGAPLSGGAEVGQTLRFTYTVRNSRSDPSPSVNCRIYTNVHGGYFAEPPTPTASGGAGPPTGCPRVFNGNSLVTLTTENVPVAAGNQTICRSLFVNPASPTAASRGDEICVPVLNKPYFKVYGGDMSAGNGQVPAGNNCAVTEDAAIIGWNRDAAGSFGGAGGQFAALAIGEIYEVATAIGNSGPNRAAVPSGLAYTNTAPSGGQYGGNFDDLPCIPDYYAEKPAGARAFTALAAANASGSGAYEWTGSTLNLSGNLAAGRRISLYVDGNVFITGNISYPGGSWTAANAPLFQLIVKGDIYIRNTVGRIDGVFIAQPDGANGGTIYTCATSAAPLAPNGSLHSRCNRKLTINGLFTANDVQLLRTNGTRQQGTANEAGSSPNVAEVFNFSPTLWLAQPVGGTPEPLQYDTITSLPPIL